MLIELVSGFAGEIRKLKGQEAQLFADPIQIKSGQSFEGMLRNCFERVTDPGPYKFLTAGERVSVKDWAKILTGDRFDALIKIRRASFGPDYEFRFQCQACKEANDWELDVDDLPRRVLAEDSRMKIEAGQNVFDVPGPEGTTFFFKLGTGADEMAAAKLKRAQKNVWGIVDALALQAVKVEGLENGAHPGRIKEWLNACDLDELLALLEATDEKNCGVDTKIEVVCSFCQWQQEIQLPFETTFFLPKPKKKAKTETTTSA